MIVTVLNMCTVTIGVFRQCMIKNHMYPVYCLLEIFVAASLKIVQIAASLRDMQVTALLELCRVFVHKFKVVFSTS